MDIDAAFKTALAAQAAGDLAACEPAYRAIVAQADHLPSLHNLGVVLENTGRFEEAGEVYRRAAAAAPDNPRPQRALANFYRMSRQFTLAEPAYRRVLALTPDDDKAAFELGMVLLAMGRTEGWALYDRREARRAMAAQPLSFPEWRGEPLSGKRLFVYREQGFGDQIMMARFLPELGAQHITYMGPPALRRLFAHLPVEWLNWSREGSRLERHDYWTLPFSSARHFSGAIPNAPYFFGDSSRNPPPAGARIGVAWRGEPANANDVFRTLPPDQAERLKALPGAISLDPADTGAADFQATADLIAGLELVITIDTAIAHLAGAMGKPVWVLLAKHATDWQWPRQPTTPWYPSARLFVQARAGDWGPLVDQVIGAVNA